MGLLSYTVSLQRFRDSVSTILADMMMIKNNKLSKNSDDRPHYRSIFHSENLLCHPTASAVGQLERQHAEKSRRQGHWERYSAACGKFQTSSSLKSVPSRGVSGPHLIHSCLAPPEATHHHKRHLGPFTVFAGLTYGRYRQTDRQTTLFCL